MNSTEIETLRVEKLKQINTDRDLMNTVSLRIHELEKELVDLKEARRKARYKLSVHMTEEKILSSEYWASRS